MLAHLTGVGQYDLPEETSPSAALQIKRVVREIFDETHPGVQELVEAGYNLRNSVEAMEQSMGDLQEAMEILDNSETEDEVEPGTGLQSTRGREDTM